MRRVRVSIEIAGRSCACGMGRWRVFFSPDFYRIRLACPCSYTDYVIRVGFVHNERRLWGDDNRAMAAGYVVHREEIGREGWVVNCGKDYMLIERRCRLYVSKVSGIVGRASGSENLLMLAIG